MNSGHLGPYTSKYIYHEIKFSVETGKQKGGTERKKKKSERRGGRNEGEMCGTQTDIYKVFIQTENEQLPNQQNPNSGLGTSDLQR